tara:strand:+ start:48 stop:1184 length:1137 start_codon:yes stop_codon:yes gene_type:complete
MPPIDPAIIEAFSGARQPTLAASGQTQIDPKLTNALIAQGVNPGPVTSKTQAFARIGTAAIGGVLENLRTDQIQAVRQRIAQSLEGLPGVGEFEMRHAQALINAGQINEAISFVKGERDRGFERAKEERGRAFTLKRDRIKQKFDKFENQTARLFKKNESELQRTFDLKALGIKFKNSKSVEDAKNALKKITDKASALVASSKVEFDQTKKLRDEFRNISQDMRKRLDAFGQIQALSKLGSSGIGDFGLIKLYNTLLEPSGRVAEGEFTAAEKSGTTAELTGLVIQKFLGFGRGDRMTEQIRKEMLEASEAIMAGSRRTFNNSRAWYRGLAIRNNLDPEDILIDFGEQPKTEAPLLSDADRRRLAELRAKRDAAGGSK